MAVEVLLRPPQDCLSPRSVIHKHNNHPCRDARNVAFKGNQCFVYSVWEPSVSRRSNTLAGGQLGRPMILRRLDSRTRSLEVVDPVDERVTRRGPLYAGSAFNVSPEPSSLPQPTFSRRKDMEDCATRDLRRLLRLE